MRKSSNTFWDRKKEKPKKNINIKLENLINEILNKDISIEEKASQLSNLLFQIFSEWRQNMKLHEGKNKGLELN